MGNRRSSKGFTLIEVIVALILMGIIGAVLAMIMAKGVDGFLLTRESAAQSQKAQLALARIERELLDMTNITAISAAPAPPSITYTTTIDGVNTRTFTIDLDGTTIEMTEVVNGTAGTARALIAPVTEFGLAYFNNAGNAWVLADGFNTLARVTVTMTLAGDRGGPLTFATTVNPRRTSLPNAPNF